MKFRRRIPSLALTACLLALQVMALRAQVNEQKLYLNRGTFIAVDGTPLPALGLNADSTYSNHNKVLAGTPGSTLRITFYNRDTTTHSLAHGTNLLATVLPGDSATFDFTVPAEGTTILHDPIGFPANAYLGAACMVASENGSPDRRFFWNIHEFQTAATQAVTAGQAFDWTQFDPDYFFVNGRSYPDTDMDSTAMIYGAIGDTLIVHVANTGKAKHTLHFHGYHFRVLHSSKSSVHKNWIKDSMPVESMETLTVELVPDKPGMYPVHDHNLLSLKGGGVYPYGLMMMIDIQ